MLSAWCVFMAWCLGLLHLCIFCVVLSSCVSTLSLPCYRTHGEVEMVSNQHVVKTVISWTHTSTNLLGGLNSPFPFLAILFPDRKHGFRSQSHQGKTDVPAASVFCDRVQSPDANHAVTCEDQAHQDGTHNHKQSHRHRARLHVTSSGGHLGWASPEPHCYTQVARSSRTHIWHFNTLRISAYNNINSMVEAKQKACLFPFARDSIIRSSHCSHSIRC